MGICSISWGIDIPANSVDEYVLAQGDSVKVYNELDSNGHYMLYCNGGLRILSSDGTALYARGICLCENENDYMEIYDGWNNGGQFLGRFSGMDSMISVMCHSGAMFIKFHSDYDVVDRGVDMWVSACVPVEEVHNFMYSQLSNTDVTVMWQDSRPTSEWKAVVRSELTGRVVDSQVVNVPIANFYGLSYGRSYTCKIIDNNNPIDCGSNIFHFDMLCEGEDVCRDFADLHSCNVTCYSGDYHNPSMNVELNVNTSASNSRHKVNRDTCEHDHAISALRVIPPGEIVSVRLGNNNVYSQAERILYHYLVDTSVYDMLIMKYAAVLEDPNHEPCNQPHFTIDIFNESGDTITPECYSRNYVANSSLGWNQMGAGLLWKDWTTVGINLDEVHGQWIDIQLTTYDCAHGGHYGYAYYTLSCLNKVICSENCGEVVNNTFTAPDGFEYEWYNTNSPTTIIGRERTLSVTSAGTYKCRMRMADAPIGSCEVEMVAYAGTRYPHARFDYKSYPNNCETTIQFYDRSVISKNQSHTQLLDIQCDDVWWDFGDGTTSSERNPRHEYDAVGTYEVTMVASLAGGTCTDTIRQTIRAGLDCSIAVMYDTVCSGADVTFFDTILSTSGIYYHRTSDTTEVWMVLTVTELPTRMEQEIICENELPWTFRGNVYNSSIIDTIVWAQSDGCDSAIIYDLKVLYNQVLDSVKRVCEDDFPVVWHGVTFEGAGIDSVVYEGAGSGGVDVKIRMTVISKLQNTIVYSDTVVENQLPYFYKGYLFDTIVKDSLLTIPMEEGCDSLIEFSLMVYYNVLDTVEKKICFHNLPYIYEDVVYDSAGIYTLHYVTSHGADSVVVLKLIVLEDKYEVEHLILCNGDSLIWQDGNMYDAPTIEPTITLVASNGCDSVVQLMLDTGFVDARFVVNPLSVTNENPKIFLEDISIGSSHRLWYLPNMISDAESWEYNYPLMEDSIRVLMVAMDEFECEDSVAVWVHKIGGQIWIPNVFTPGEDENNIFKVVGDDLLDIEVLIFDRRGQFIYSYNTLDGYWDGTMDGTLCPQAAYVYKVRYHTKSYPERTQSAVGTVTLLR